MFLSHWIVEKSLLGLYGESLFLGILLLLATAIGLRKLRAYKPA